MTMFLVFCLRVDGVILLLYMYMPHLKIRTMTSKIVFIKK